jgi:hypothetical protein
MTFASADPTAAVTEIRCPALQRGVRDITTSSEAPIFKAPSNMPNKACVPRGSNGRRNTRHSLDESRAAHKETSPQVAHGSKTSSAAAARFAVAAARSKKKCLC